MRTANDWHAASMAFKFNHRDRLRYVTHGSSTVIRILQACRMRLSSQSIAIAAATRFE
jgi:hypothetical protein